MYSYEERIKAVELYIQYDFQAELTAAELGYATAKSIQRWYKEFQKQGNLHKKRISLKKYTEAQKEQAIKYYSEHGRSVARTVRALGYPNRDTMFQWLDEAFPNRKKCCISKNALIEFPPEKKEQAVTSVPVLALRKKLRKHMESAESHFISGKRSCSMRGVMPLCQRRPLLSNINLKGTPSKTCRTKKPLWRSRCRF